MVKLTQIKTGKLLYFVKAVNQSVSVNKQLSGCFGNIQIVLKEALNCKQGFVVKRLNGALLEYFLEEGFTKSCGQVINKSCDAQIIIGNNVFVSIKHLTYFKSHLRLLEGTCKVLNAYYGSTDTDIYPCKEFAGQCIGNGTRKLFQVLNINIILDFLNQYDIRFGNIENKVLVLVREQILDYVISGNIVGRNNID